VCTLLSVSFPSLSVLRGASWSWRRVVSKYTPPQPRHNTGRHPSLGFYLLYIEGRLVAHAAATTTQFWKTSESQLLSTLYWGVLVVVTACSVHLSIRRHNHQPILEDFRGRRVPGGPGLVPSAEGPSGTRRDWRVVRVAVTTTSQFWRVSAGDESEEAWIWYHL